MSVSNSYNLLNYYYHNVGIVRIYIQNTIYFCFQDSEDLFNFIPNQQLKESVTSRLNLKRKNDAAGPPQKRERQQNYSYIKTRAPNTSSRTFAIKIEIYESDNLPEKPCECNANKCVQYITENAVTSDIYLDLENIISKIRENV